MKKLFLVALMLVGLTTFAQDKRVGKAERPKLSSDEKVEKQVEKLRTDLALNEKQVAEVKALVTEQVKKREAKKAEIKAIKTADRKEMMAKMKDEQTAMKDKMKKILTAEQFTKWEANREEMKDKMREKRKDRKSKDVKPEDKL